MTLRSITGEALSAAAQKSTFHKPKPYNHTSEAARVKVPSLLCMEGPCRRFSIKRAHFQDKRTVKRLGAGGGRLPPRGQNLQSMNHAINATTLETHTHIPVSGVVRLYFQGLCVHMLNLAGYARARSRRVVLYVPHTCVCGWTVCLWCRVKPYIYGFTVRLYKIEFKLLYVVRSSPLQ